MRADYSRVTHPCAALLRAETPFTLDLHVLGLPPAFVLSQDQTLQFDLFRHPLRDDLDFVSTTTKTVVYFPVLRTGIFRLALMLLSNFIR